MTLSINGEKSLNTSFKFPKVTNIHPMGDILIKKYDLKPLPMPLIPSLETIFTPGMIGAVLGSMYGCYIMKMKTIWDKKYTYQHMIKENPAYIFWGTVAGFSLGSLTGKIFSFIKYK